MIVLSRPGMNQTFISASGATATAADAAVLRERINDG